jgi:prepilin-type N-terminal cleavage/methylation domain-containing protein
MAGRRRSPGAAGFTLLEIIVVLAVIAALAAILTPVVFRFIDDARTNEAKANANMLATAIVQLFKDTGRWPFCKNCQGPLAYQAAADADHLTSNEACTGAAALSTCDTRAPADGTAGALWAMGAGRADSLTNHLIKNTPFGGTAGSAAYATTGAKKWKGPYLDRSPGTDPWGRSFVVNIKNADPAKEQSDTTANGLRWTIVISGGPDGTLQTDPTTFAVANPSPVGDDVVARAK